MVQRKKYAFSALNSKVRKKVMFLKIYILFFYVGLNLIFYTLKVSFDEIKLDLILKSSSLTLGFAIRLSLQYTLKTLY